MKLNILDQFSKLVDSAIEINKFNRRLYTKESKWCFDPISYAKEFCTIHINCGRRLGKSEYIYEHFKEGDVLIVPSFPIKARSKEYLESDDVYTPKECENGVPSFYINKMKGYPQTILLDDIGYCTNQEINWVYNAFVDNSYNQTWIRLGE